MEVKSEGEDEKGEERQQKPVEQAPSAKELRRIREERQEALREKKAVRENNKKGRVRRKKEQKEELIRRGQEKCMNQQYVKNNVSARITKLCTDDNNEYNVSFIY